MTEILAVTLNLYWDLCEKATVIPSNLSFTTVTGLIAMPATTQTFAAFSDSGAKKYSQVDVCQEKVYTVEPSYSFITMIAPVGDPFLDDWTIKVLSNDKLVAGVYPVKLVCKLANFPLSVSYSYEFTVEMIDTCLTTQINKVLLDPMKTIVKNPAVTQTFL